jgi:hypothetical protein
LKNKIETEIFSKAKLADPASWSWDESLDIPYTRSVIESMPINPIGMVVVGIFAGLPMHSDWNDQTDTEHTLGLNIIPNTGDTAPKIWYEKENRFVTVPGNAAFLNDSIKHEIPPNNGTRITVRVFGNIDYSWFDDKIDPTCCYYF